MNIEAAFNQIRYLFFELKLLVNYQWWRWITCWFGSSAGVIVSYRVDRFFYLLFGNFWAGLRILFFPFFLFLRLISAPHEIHYRADIGCGLKILHTTLGVVVSGYTKAGRGLVLTGGNCIGIRYAQSKKVITVGDNVVMGVNSVILGPVTVGNRVHIGAGAVVTHDSPDDVVLVGVPACIKQS